MPDRPRDRADRGSLRPVRSASADRGRAGAELSRLDRRQFLRHSVGLAGAAALRGGLPRVVGSAARVALPASVAACAAAASAEQHPFLPPATAPPSDQVAVEEAVVWMLATPQDGLLARAKAELLAGLPVATLDDAVGLAMMRRVPGFASGDAHRVFAWQALRAHKARVPERDALEWALWSLHGVAAPVDQDRWGASTYVQPVTFSSAATAAADYERAVLCAQPFAAESAAMARFAADGWAGVLDLFFRMSLSRLGELAHAAIGAVHLAGAVAALGEAHAPLFVRFVSRTQAYVFETGVVPVRSSDPYLRAWHQSLAAARALPVASDAGAPDPAASLSVIALVQGGDVAQAVAGVRDLRTSGVAATSVWDGLVCAAAEHLWVRKATPTARRGMEVHALTNVNAMRSIARHPLASEETRALALFQATSLLTLFVVDGERRPFSALTPSAAAGTELSALRQRLGGAEPEQPVGAAPALAHEATQLEVAQALLHAVDAGADPVAWVDSALAQLRGVTKTTHPVKFTVALREELTRVAPTLRRRLLPSLGFYLTGADAPPWAAKAEAEAVAAAVLP